MPRREKGFVGEADCTQSAKWQAIAWLCGPVALHRGDGSAMPLLSFRLDPNLFGLWGRGKAGRLDPRIQKSYGDEELLIL